MLPAHSQLSCEQVVKSFARLKVDCLALRHKFAESPREVYQRADIKSKGKLEASPQWGANKNRKVCLQGGPRSVAAENANNSGGRDGARPSHVSKAYGLM